MKRIKDNDIYWVSLLGGMIGYMCFLYPLFFQDISPYILLSSDTGNVASILAAWLHPELFNHDIVFSTPEHYRFYISGILYLAWLLSFAVSDIGLIFHLMVIVLIALQFEGFYILGKKVFDDNKIMAFTLAISNLAFINIGGGEFWGVYTFEALSRVFVNAFLPYLLLFLLEHREKPKHWPFLFLLLSAAFYFHSVSAPTLAFALGFALLFQPVNFVKKIKNLFIGSGVFILSLVPFVYFYLQAFVTDNSMTQTMLDQHVGVYFQNVGTALEAIFNSKLDIALLTLGGLGFIFSKNKEARTLGIFLIGTIIASAGVCFIDQTVAHFFDRAPLQFDLIRNMRFVFPLLFIGIGFLFYRLKKGSFLFFLLMVFVCYKNPIHYFLMPMKSENQAQKLEDKMQAAHEVQTFIRYFKSSKTSHIILPIGHPQTMDLEALSFRYQAFQSVAYTQKDRNFLIYTNSKSYPKWEALHTHITALPDQEKKDAKETVALLLRDTRADYIYFDKRFDKKELLISILKAYAEPILETPNRLLLKVKR